MRTTLNLTEDVLIAARNVAQRERLSLGDAVSALVRRGALVQAPAQAMQNQPALRGRFALSGLMLGLGETETELFQAMDDLREHGVTVLTLGQYLQPTKAHLPVKNYITPEQFDEYGAVAKQLGFKQVASAPMVRSSYHADLQAKAII